MAQKKYEEMNDKVGDQETMECPKCKKKQLHIFSKESGVFSSTWFWQCSCCKRRVDVYKY